MVLPWLLRQDPLATGASGQGRMVTLHPHSCRLEFIEWPRPQPNQLANLRRRGAAGKALEKEWMLDRSGTRVNLLHPVSRFICARNISSHAEMVCQREPTKELSRAVSSDQLNDAHVHLVWESFTAKMLSRSSANKVRTQQGLDPPSIFVRYRWSSR
jgi:hypothetical protein